jgi:hypothetical protein
MNNTRKSFSRNPSRNRFTHHASARCQQRGIPPHMVNMVLTHGETRSAGGGCHSVLLTRASIQNVRFLLPKADVIQMEKLQGVNVIVNDRDGAIVTVKRTTRHIRR